MSTEKDKPPYVGPRTFEADERDRFFGREREARDLFARVVSERLVLFYAQSGAGKSSLVNTCLIADLRAKNFAVFATGRVAGDAPPGTEVGNIFVFNLKQSLTKSEVMPSVQAKLSISEIISKLKNDIAPVVETEDEDQASTPHVLIIDQFEELFSTHPEAWAKREDFFQQLSDAMEDDPYLWVVLVMREDYIASLDPYAHLLPGRLGRRYYMQRLEREAAIKAVKGPVEKLCPFAAGVAEKLVDDLSSIRVRKPDNTLEIQAGQFVEPVQLQVVCSSLWEKLPVDVTEITQEYLDKYVVDVNQALGNYYEKRVKTVVDGEIAAKNGAKERDIREWFGSKLITADGIRNMIAQESGRKSGGLDDNVIQEFVKRGDLVRAEQRGGAIFYELTHDRLVEPILQNNKEWSSSNSSLLQKQAAQWLQQGYSNGLLLYGKDLRKAEKEAETLQPTKDEQGFLEASKLSDKRRKTLWIATAFVFIALAILSFAAIQQSRLAMANAALADQNQQVAWHNAELARINEEEAKKAKEEAISAKIIAEAGQYAALAQAKSQGELVLSLLFGVESYRIVDNSVTRGALLDVVSSSPHFLQPLFAHSDSVISVAFSSDGKTLASGGQDHKIILWDLFTRQPISEPLEGHKESVLSLAFNPDGSILASAGDDDTIILWDTKTHRQTGQPLNGHGDSVHSIAFSPDGSMLASGSWDDKVILWDTSTHFPIGEPLIGHEDDIYGVAFSPDGKILASGSLDQTIILWDIATRKPIGQPLNANGSDVESVVFSPDGQILASAGFDNSITLWDVATHQQIVRLMGHTNWVSSVAYSPDGNTLASGSADGTIILWDMATRQLRDTLTGAGSVVRSLAFSPDGKILASGDLDKAVILWDVIPRQSIGQLITTDQGDINSVAISPDGKMLASGSNDSTFALFDMSTRQPIGSSHKDHNRSVEAITFSPDGKFLASGGFSTGIFLWDIPTSTSISPSLLASEKAFDYVFSLAFSPDSKTLASGNWEDTIILWDVDAQKRIGEPLEGHEQRNDDSRLAVSSVAFSPDGRILASSSEDKTIILWDASNKKSVAQLKGHTAPVYGVAFSPDGKLLASASHDRNIILWNVDTFQPIGEPLTGHLGGVQTVAFSFDGKVLASGSTDNTIILWDIASRQPIGQPLTGHTGTVNSLVFVPGGRTLVSASNEIIVWDLEPQSWLEKSCQRAGRNFTRAEWAQYFPNEEYRKTCEQWPLEPEITATPTP